MRPIKFFFNEIASNFDLAASTEFDWKPPEQVYKLLNRYVNKKTRILDIGIGTGESVMAFKNRGTCIYGVDISPKMLSIAKQKIPRLNTIEADIEKDTYACGLKFDVVLAIGVFEFIKDLDYQFRLIKSMLVQEGLLCFTFEEYLPNYYGQSEEISDAGIKTENLVLNAGFYVHRRNWDDIESLLDKYSYDVLAKDSFHAYYRYKGETPVYYGLVLAKLTV